jgi:prepilin-type N-terminal cleavage/methylation domain-containing protein
MFKTQTPLVSNKRTGFTLVELLVVIAIIVILVSLSAGGVFKFLSYQKQVATDRTKDQVNAAIERVLKNIRTKAHTDYASISTNNSSFSTVLRSIGKNLQSGNLIGIREQNRRDELVFVNIQIARSFPLKFSDLSASKIPFIYNSPVIFPPNLSVRSRFIAFSLDGTINNFNSNAINKEFDLDTTAKVIPSIVQAFSGVISTNQNTPEIVALENAACLLMALEANPDGLKGELLGTSVTTDPATRARYISTADGKPIGFQLRYLDLQAGGSKSVVGTVTVELIVP